MFFVWLGMIAGFGFAYLWHDWSGRPWRKPQWWPVPIFLALACSLALYEFFLEASGSFGLREALKSVLLPVAAGIVFGIWFHALIMPPPQPGATPAEQKTAAAGARTFQRLLVCVLFVGLIVSEDRYRWLERLQKLSVGGNSIEFSSGGGASMVAERSLGPTPTLANVQSGENKVDRLFRFMRDLPIHIKEDVSFYDGVFRGALPTSESALAEPLDISLSWDEIFGNDYRFAHMVAHPIGKSIERMHASRRYSSSEFIVPRSFADDFRAFVEASPQERAGGVQRRGSIESVVEGLKQIWAVACEFTPVSDAAASGAGPDHADHCPDAATRDNRLAAVIAAHTFNPKLPYGTILSALLLDTIGEHEAALRQADGWVEQFAAGSTGAEGGDARRLLFPRYRLITHGASLDLGYGALRRLTMDWLRMSLDLGESILSRAPWVNFSEHIYRNGILDNLVPNRCAERTSLKFKVFARVHFSYVNTYLYYVSEDRNLMGSEAHKKKFHTRLAQLERLKVQCIQPDPSYYGANSARMKAAFQDTISAIHTVLATQENITRKRRALLCSALQHAREAVSFQRDYQEIRSSHRGAAAEGTWDRKIDHAHSMATTADYQDRASRIEALLRGNRYECPS